MLTEEYANLRGLMYVTANLTMRGFESQEGQVMNSLVHIFRSIIIQSWLKITYQLFTTLTCIGLWKFLLGLFVIYTETSTYFLLCEV